MPIEILMPAISPSTLACKLVRWHVGAGAAVRKGDVLAELETDKAVMDIEAPADGVLERILVPDDSPDIPVETVIGLIGDGKEAAAPSAGSPEPQPSGGEPASPDLDNEPLRRVSPLARRLARQHGIDPDRVRGTGPKGRVIAADIREATARASAISAPPAAPVEPAKAEATTLPAPASSDATPRPSLNVEPHGAMRRTIARRLVESKQTVPHFYLEARCEADALLAMRAQLNAALAANGGGARLTVNDLIMKAYAVAIAGSPDTMVTWSEEGLVQHATVDLGMAVALEDGLITPILRDVARLSLGALANASKEASERARAGRLSPDEYSGGLAGISNLGMYGISAFSAIINPPQSMNLAVGAAEAEIALREGRTVEVQRMRLTLSVDHRAIDGAAGARLMQRLKSLIETPLLMVA